MKTAVRMTWSQCKYPIAGVCFNVPLIKCKLGAEAASQEANAIILQHFAGSNLVKN